MARGVDNTYIEDNLRYSQNAPLDMYKEVNTGTNLPAQIDLYAVDGDEYNSSVSPKVVVRQTRRISIRKPKRY
ncbi:fumarate hydratase [Escherichia coli]